MKTAIVQMLTKHQTTEDIETACDGIAQAAKSKSDFVVLPEMFCCPYKASNFPVYAQEQGGENWQALSNAAKKNGVYLVAGSMPERDGENIFNTCYIFDRDGKQIGKHRKMHLFDCSIKGGQHFCESETLSAGNSVTTYDTEFGTMGTLICFDIRFPELSRIMADRGAKMIFAPAAFNMTSGPAFWDIMFRTRAVDNQMFYAAAAPARDTSYSYVAYGNSMVVSPWGKILARLDEKPCMLYCDIDFNELNEVKEQMPVMKQRRLDIYHIECTKK